MGGPAQIKSDTPSTAQSVSESETMDDPLLVHILDRFPIGNRNYPSQVQNTHAI